MKRVIIESPLAGNFERNRCYALWCLHDSLLRGEAPFASHLLYTQCLDDTEPASREIGIEAGFAWSEVADLRAFYLDLGMSDGMRRARPTTLDEMRYLPSAMLDAFARGEYPAATPAFEVL